MTGSVVTVHTKSIVRRIPVPKKDYTLDEIDAIVSIYKDGAPTERSEALVTLIDIFEFYFLKYVKLTKSGMTKDFDNRDAVEFLSLFTSVKGGQRKSFSEVKRNIAATLDSYEAEDLYNEFVALFIVLLNKYQKREGINFMRYITRYFRWHVRNWICRVSRDPLFWSIDPEDEETKTQIMETPAVTKTPYFEEASAKFGTILDDKDIHPDSVSLSWVIKCDKWLFSSLSFYQRYLLYLYFTKGEGMVVIARRLGKSKDTITAHMNKIYRKIGRLANKIV